LNKSCLQPGKTFHLPTEESISNHCLSFSFHQRISGQSIQSPQVRLRRVVRSRRRWRRRRKGMSSILWNIFHSQLLFFVLDALWSFIAIQTRLISIFSYIVSIDTSCGSRHSEHSLTFVAAEILWKEGPFHNTPRLCCLLLDLWWIP
jgi:hypothetical protein